MGIQIHMSLNSTLQASQLFYLQETQYTTLAAILRKQCTALLQLIPIRKNQTVPKLEAMRLQKESNSVDSQQQRTLELQACGFSALLTKNSPIVLMLVMKSNLFWFWIRKNLVFKTWNLQLSVQCTQVKIKKWAQCTLWQLTWVAQRT